jgi:hypothetical protein
MLCLLFLPEHSEAEARRNLTRTLTHLRRALPPVEALVTDEDQVYLDNRFFWCDAVEFCQPANPEQPYPVLTLYRGAFLEGFYLSDCPDFEAWVTKERAYFESASGGLAALLEQITDGIIPAPSICTPLLKPMRCRGYHRRDSTVRFSAIALEPCASMKTALRSWKMSWVPDRCPKPRRFTTLFCRGGWLACR